jgi:hypothetical protein
LVLSAFWRHLQQASVDMPAALILLYPMRMMVAVSEIWFAANVSKGYAILSWVNRQNFNGCGLWLPHWSYPAFVFVERQVDGHSQTD